MNCTFLKKQEVVEVMPLCLESNEVTDNYILKVMGLDADGNYTNAGHLFLSENEVNELIAGNYIENPKQLIGRKLAVVSNALCKEASIHNWNTALTEDEWQILQPFIEKNKNPFYDLDEGEVLEF